MRHMISARPISDRLSRRQFLKAAGGLGLSAAGLALLEACGAKPTGSAAAGGALETTTIRIPYPNNVSLCTAPQYIAEDYLRAEGFTNVEYVKLASVALTADSLSAGETDMLMQFSGPSLLSLDAGKQITLLAGLHVGCFVLFGSPRIHQISDLKGTTIAISQVGSPDHVYLASMLAAVNIDPVKDVNWITRPPAESKQLFSDGKIDAFLGFPPTAQEFQDNHVGHVVVNSMVDKPWSLYFCCMATMNRDFVRKYPVATKRALRALLRATDVCALEPERAAKLMVAKGFATNYTYTLELMQEIPYNRWREYNPEDTVPYYSLLLHDAQMVKSTPDEIINNGTDWRFLNEIKAELSATPTPAAALASSRSLFCALDNRRTAGQQRPRAAE